MADEKKSGSKEQCSPERAEPPATRAEARARLRGVMGTTPPDMSAAAARAIADIRLGIANRGARLGFLDDIVDIVDDVADVTEEVINHVAANTEEITEMLEDATPEICPLTVITLGVASEGAGEGTVPGTEDPQGASAKQILEVRKAVLETIALQKKGFQAIAQSMRAQLAAMRRPK